MSYNQKADRTFRINGSLSVDGSVALFVQDLEISMDAGVFQRDSTGTGESVFTQNSDVLGSFSFNLKNTIDLYDGTNPSTNNKKVSKWMYDISIFNPSIVNFIQTFNAPKSAGDKFARISFIGRIMKVTPSQNVSEGVDNVIVDGEVTAFTSAQRAAS